MRIYLSPSGQKYNKYVDGIHTEEEICRQIAEKVACYLVSEGIETQVAASYNNDSEWKARCTESDNMKADYHIAIHTNAGGGHGVRILCNPSRVGEDIMKKSCEEIKKILPKGHQTGTVVGTSNLYEINVPRAKTIYYEIAFHDCEVECSWLVNNVEQIAKAIVKGITGIDVKNTAPIYRVQLGAYRDKANADRLLADLKAKGFDGFIKVTIE